MREPTTYIKLDRNILDWRWIGDANTLAVWVWLLLNANIEPTDFRDFRIERGEVLFSVDQIADKLGMSVKNVRTALEHLTKTGEIQKKRRSKNKVLYIIEGFSRYQAKPAFTWQSSGDLPAINRQSSGDQVANSRKEERSKEEVAPIGEEKKNLRIKEFKNGRRAYAREAPKTGAALFEELGEELRRQEAEEAKRNDAGGNE